MQHFRALFEDLNHFQSSGHAQMISEIHLNMVEKMMNYYDSLTESRNIEETLDSIFTVLKCIGWDYEGSEEHLNKFARELGLEKDHKLHDRDEIRNIFLAWFEKVTSEPALLLECFAFFNHNADGILSNEEIMRIMYRTVDEKQIKRCHDLLTNLPKKVHYKRLLGMELRSSKSQEKSRSISRSSLSGSEVKQATSPIKLFFIGFVISIFIMNLLWAFIVIVFMPVYGF